MVNSDLSFILYFIFVGISIFGIAFIGEFLTRKLGKERPYEIPESNKPFLTFFWIFVLFYLVAAGLEYLGHFIGIWTWSSLSFIPLHALVWWAPCLTVSLFTLASLNKYLRYIILLGFVLLFEILQEAFVHFVTHNSFIFGTPYITIIIVMSIVCLTSFIALDLVKGLNLLN